MTDARHPFAITTQLPPEFGYSKAFLAGSLPWELVESTTASTGGGRMSDNAIIKLVSELGDYTREDEDLAAREMQLKHLFSNHFDAPHIQFLLKFFVEGSPAITTKSEAIDALVTKGVPFIPWSILNEHLLYGAVKLKAKAKLPLLNWEPAYKAFCDANVKPPAPPPPPSDEAKSLRVAKIFDFWEKALVSHNAAVAPAKQVHFTDSDLQSFTGSQFSTSDSGKFRVSKTSSMAGDLRAKLDLLQPNLQERASKSARIKELQRELRDLDDDSDDGSKASRPSKKRRERRNSGSDSDSEQGVSALECFMKTMKDKIERRQYIDFASLSTTRLHEIKMLNSSSSKTTRIQANLSFRQFLSEADVKTLSEDLEAIFDGFLYHYLKMVSESHLPTPVKVVFDRIQWWQWVSSNFTGNPAAQVMYIKHFMVEHHMEEFWEPIAKNSYTLVAKCRDAFSTPLFSAPRPPKTPHSSRATPPGGPSLGGKGGRKSDYTAAQLVKLASFKSRFPDICLSRVIKGRNCPNEKRHTSCKYKHVCAWCASTSCRATCNLAEPF